MIIYKGNLIIDVIKNTIKVDLEITCDNNKEKFYINKNMDTVEITSKNNITYEVSKGVVPSSKIISETKKICLDGGEKNLTFNIKYAGEIINNNTINQVKEDWTELGCYLPWFPINKKLDKCKFQIDVTCIGGENSKILYPLSKESIIDFSCPVFISNNHSMEEVVSGKTKVIIYFREKEGKELKDIIKNSADKILTHFIETFGKLEEDIILTVVISPRKKGGDYCRKNLIVLNESENNLDKTSYEQYFAHELAHLWWTHGNMDSWEDWLNESFAEYSVLSYVRSEYGEKVLTEKIKKYEEKIKGTPPIFNLDRGHEMSYLALYPKGALILNKLYGFLGEQEFNRLLKRVSMLKINNTSHLFEVIENEFSSEARKKLEWNLRNF
ncbi:M1 family aminopeptidase [Psychrilyobacter atlanticus]|uniref:M1 family aminopeptidase n=1 Tax=Psychrilyobacter atlanticus TaxID=271091 RepID=UPI0004092972|nr:M1 family aminopeptidase [Psychrilyobacter atlanticus]